MAIAAAGGAAAITCSCMRRVIRYQVNAVAVVKTIEPDWRPSRPAGGGRFGPRRTGKANNIVKRYIRLPASRLAPTGVMQDDRAHSP